MESDFTFTLRMTAMKGRESETDHKPQAERNIRDRHGPWSPPVRERLDRIADDANRAVLTAVTMPLFPPQGIPPWIWPEMCRCKKSVRVARCVKRGLTNCGEQITMVAEIENHSHYQ